MVGGSAFELVRGGQPGSVFADEFNGTRVDANKWSSGYPWGCTNETTGERQCYVPEALAVRDGRLVMEADRVPGGHRRPGLGGTGRAPERDHGPARPRLHRRRLPAWPARAGPGSGAVVAWRLGGLGARVGPGPLQLLVQVVGVGISPRARGDLQDAAAAPDAYRSLADHLPTVGLEAPVAADLANLLDVVGAAGIRR